MLNQCILVGKVLSIRKEQKVAVVTLSIARGYKEQGEEDYQVDELDIELSNHLSTTALEYLKENATVGIKARIASRSKIIANIEIKLHAIVAEKLTFINSKQKEEK